MPWTDHEPVVGQDQESAHVKALRQEIAPLLDNSPNFTKMLRDYLQAPTYMKARSLDEVAFHEGQRFLARTIMQLGGKFDE